MGPELFLLLIAAYPIATVLFVRSERKLRAKPLPEWLAKIVGTRANSMISQVKRDARHLMWWHVILCVGLCANIPLRSVTTVGIILSITALSNAVGAVAHWKISRQLSDNASAN